MTDLLRMVGLNRYELNARLKPALLAGLPALIVAVFWYPGAWSFAGTLVAAASACGVLYALAQFARRRGRAVEAVLNRDVGRNHTARLLTHLDDAIFEETKARYYAYLRSQGLVLSTASEEQAEPDLAFRRARSAVDWLLEHTRTGGGALFLLDENISYGFQRNLFGLKPYGIALSVISLAAHALLLFVVEIDAERFWFGVALCLPLAVLVCVWLLVVNKSAVVDASLAYAKRLLANCETSRITASAGRGSVGRDEVKRPTPKPRKRKETSA